MRVTENGVQVLCLGEAVVDFFPQMPGVPLSQAHTFCRHLGGAPTNVAVGLARAGVRVVLLTMVGADDFGVFVREQLIREGVCVDAVHRHARARTPITFVEVSASGERRFVSYREGAADGQLACEHVDEALIAQARMLHVGSSMLAREPARSATWKAVSLARRAGCFISCDPNLRLRLWADPDEARQLTRQLVGQADFVKVANDELVDLVGTSDVREGARALRALGPGLAVVTLGERGAYYDAAAGTGVVAGVEVPLVDGTGAGDAFVAGMLAVLCGLLEPGGSTAQLDVPAIEAAIARGNAFGALAVTQVGATTALLRLAGT